MNWLLIAASLCSMDFTGLPRDVYALVYFDHEDEDHRGTRYIYQTPTVQVVDGKVTIGEQYTGKPVAVEIYARMTGTSLPFVMVRKCGTLPDPVVPQVFADGFEMGTTERWDQEAP